MFERRTTIILGAGASAHCGFPLGPALRTEVLTAINALKEQLRPPITHIGFSASNAHEFFHHGLLALATYLKSPPARDHVPKDFAPARELLGFGEALGQATHDSMDRFIRDNPTRQFVGKLLIAYRILLRMYKFHDGQYVRKTFADREYSKRRNWYLQLINLLREGASTAEQLAGNRLTIVTFNYDLSLECALKKALGDTERHAGVDFRRVVNIHHMNGAPGDIPDTITDVGRFLLDCAKSLHLVEEAVSDVTFETREQAKLAIEKSKRVFIVGFHLDEANTKLLGLCRDEAARVGTHCLNFDGHGGVHQRARNLKIPEANIVAGTSQRPLFIDEAIDHGFLER